MSNRDFATMTDADWLEMASEMDAQRAEQLRHRAESFQRSDTDGFLSQWASGLGAELAYRQAEIARNLGRAEFTGLYDGDRRVRAQMKTFPDRYRGYGTKTMWLLDEDEAERYGRKWIPIGERSRVQRDLGLSERTETAPAWAKFDGHGTGLSGTCWVAIYRRGDKWGGDAVLVEEESVRNSAA